MLFSFCLPLVCFVLHLLPSCHFAVSRGDAVARLSQKNPIRNGLGFFVPTVLFRRLGKHRLTMHLVFCSLRGKSMGQKATVSSCYFFYCFFEINLCFVCVFCSVAISNKPLCQPGFTPSWQRRHKKNSRLTSHSNLPISCVPLFLPMISKNTNGIIVFFYLFIPKIQMELPQILNM